MEDGNAMSHLDDCSYCSQLERKEMTPEERAEIEQRIAKNEERLKEINIAIGNAELQLLELLAQLEGRQN